MNRLLFGVAVCVLLIGCQTTQPPQYTENDKIASLQEHYSCVEQNVLKLDDGRSDAYTVANAVATLCEEQYKNYVRIAVSGASSRARMMATKSLLSEQADLIVPMVLKMRAQAGQ